MPTALTSATTTAARTPHRLVLTDPADVQHAADALADGGVVGHGFANVYAITTRPDADIVQRVNHMHDRPTDGPGSITVPPERIPDLFDWTQLPPGLTRRSVLRAVDAFYRSGPFRFRGPAAEHIPPPDLPRGGRRDDAESSRPATTAHRTTSWPGRWPPQTATYSTSPRRTRPTTAPASRFSSIRTMNAARSRYPGYQATSVTILAFAAAARRRRSSPTAVARTARVARCRHRAPGARRPRLRPRSASGDRTAAADNQLPRRDTGGLSNGAAWPRRALLNPRSGLAGSVRQPGRGARYRHSGSQPVPRLPDICAPTRRSAQVKPHPRIRTVRPDGGESSGGEKSFRQGTAMHRVTRGPICRDSERLDGRTLSCPERRPPPAGRDLGRQPERVLARDRVPGVPGTPLGP